MGLFSIFSDKKRNALLNTAMSDNTVQTVTVENRFSIDIPSFLPPTNKFKDFATLQYWEKGLDLSFLVMEKKKTVFAETVEDLKTKIPKFIEGKSTLEVLMYVALANLYDDINKVVTSDRRDITINGMNAIMIYAQEKRGLNIKLAFFEGKETLYYIVIMSESDAIEKLVDKFDRSIMSFKEL